jgi:hypothetical protein
LQVFAWGWPSPAINEWRRLAAPPLLLLLLPPRSPVPRRS